MDYLENGIQKLDTENEKQLWEQSLRLLWRDCFGDPQRYEDFYFETVYKRNQVLLCFQKGQDENGELQKDNSSCPIGMLHLNPYMCMVEGSLFPLWYVVGVATRPDRRRQGIMRQLLCTALKEMYDKENPFLYLMPANTAYYEPFDFIQIQKKEEVFFSTGHPLLPSSVVYIPYQELKYYFAEDMDCLLAYVNRWFLANYSGYIFHDSQYFDLLVKEKACEGGEVVFCFHEAVGLENLFGFFAYGKDEEQIFVEQALFVRTGEWNGTGKEDSYKRLEPEKTKEVLSDYFQKQQQKENRSIVYTSSYPYMVRVVHVESFLKLFAGCFREYGELGIRLRIEDGICSANNGIYQFHIEDTKVKVTRHRQLDVDYDRNMTVRDLAEYVFEKKQMFFAEIV